MPGKEVDGRGGDVACHGQAAVGIHGDGSQCVARGAAAGERAERDVSVTRREQLVVGRLRADIDRAVGGGQRSGDDVAAIGGDVDVVVSAGSGVMGGQSAQGSDRAGAIAQGNRRGVEAVGAFGGRADGAVDQQIAPGLAEVIGEQDHVAVGTALESPCCFGIGGDTAHFDAGRGAHGDAGVAAIAADIGAREIAQLDAAGIGLDTDRAGDRGDVPARDGAGTAADDDVAALGAQGAEAEVADT